jgi:hypothetical protein
MVYYGSLHLAPHHLTLWSQSNAHRYNPLLYCKCKAFCIYIILYCIVSAKHCVFVIYNSKKIIGLQKMNWFGAASLKFEGYNEKSKRGMHLVHFSFFNRLHMFFIFNASCSPFMLELTIHFLFLNDFQSQNKLMHQFITSQI